ncbi:hypothetical protein BKM63_00295 [Flavobacterium johnsoniae]|uniref:Uncharacterized protein n=1 Tax=Flavobacterium johnsoniae TaxID=986 RepID=A0A1J7BYK6_FLAJO|nr:hypothetical protein BKM63_00295 [Flavobacterium johnsoniae]
MPKNKFFKRLFYPLKNYFFYLLSHFIFQSAFRLNLENILPKLFSAQNINTQEILLLKLQP